LKIRLRRVVEEMDISKDGGVVVSEKRKDAK
jgi:hypothetical protein